MINAAGHGKLTTVIAQLSVGTDPNAQDAHGFTPLHYAALNLKTRVVAWLLANGANPEASDNSANLTPLELLNVRLSNRADRAKFFAGAGGGVGIFAGLHSRLGLAKERKEAEPIIALLRRGSENRTWLDTLEPDADARLHTDHAVRRRGAAWPLVRRYGHQRGAPTAGHFACANSTHRPERPIGRLRPGRQ